MFEGKKIKTSELDLGDARAYSRLLQEKTSKLESMLHVFTQVRPSDYDIEGLGESYLRVVKAHEDALEVNML
jgi:hypothetical protein